jgi:hypothetical protein
VLARLVTRLSPRARRVVLYLVWVMPRVVYCTWAGHDWEALADREAGTFRWGCRRCALVTPKAFLLHQGRLH